MAEQKDSYKNFIQNVELEEIFLQGLKAKRFEIIPTGSANVNISTHFALSERQTDGIIALAQFKVEINNSEEGQTTPFFIHADFILRYSFPKGLEVADEVIKQFINRNVPLNSWPYARELISSITTRMGLPPLVIGTLKLL